MALSCPGRDLRPINGANRVCLRSLSSDQNPNFRNHQAGPVGATPNWVRKVVSLKLLARSRFQKRKNNLLQERTYLRL